MCLPYIVSNNPMGKLLFFTYKWRNKWSKKLNKPCSEFLILALCSKIGFISILYFLEKLTLKSLSLVVFQMGLKRRSSWPSIQQTMCHVLWSLPWDILRLQGFIFGELDLGLPRRVKVWKLVRNQHQNSHQYFYFLIFLVYFWSEDNCFTMLYCFLL